MMMMMMGAYNALIPVSHAQRQWHNFTEPTRYDPRVAAMQPCPRPTCVSLQAHTARQWVGVKGGTHKRHQSNCKSGHSFVWGSTANQLQTG
jgi:hypothetical protein